MFGTIAEVAIGEVLIFVVEVEEFRVVRIVGLAATEIGVFISSA